MNFCNYIKSQIHDNLFPGINNYDESTQEQIISTIQKAMCDINQRVHLDWKNNPDGLFDINPEFLILLSDGIISVQHPRGMIANINLQHCK